MKPIAQGPTALSWRDPDGFVVRFEGRILRAVVKEKSDQIQALLVEPWIQGLIARGSIPGSTHLSDEPRVMEAMERWYWLEHEVLSFPVYPHEITALQLYDAARLTMEIAILAAQENWILKDASAWNVLYSDGRPIFVDVLSFERRTRATAWVAYGQFVRHFILPLMLYKRLGMTPVEIFLLNRDGITPERAYRLLAGTSLLSANAMEFVVLPKWLAPAGGRKIAAERQSTTAYIGPVGTDLLMHTLLRLQRKLVKLRPDETASGSVWKQYEEDRTHYSDADITAKKDFVRHHLTGGGSVLDLGCNAGEFSLIAAECGASVVATDFDHGALSRLYERIRGKATRVSPLMLNIARPSPAIGWQNQEIAAFIERATGRFDCILALGLIHHLLVSERSTLAMVADLFDLLDPKRVLVEWVDPRDAKFQQVAGLNAALYTDLNTDRFEASLASKFRLERKLVLPCATRVMYLWTR